MIPDPLPELLPDETRSAYKRRVIPDWRERMQLVKQRGSFVRGLINDARNNDQCLDEDDVQAISEDARDEWARTFPEQADRLAHLKAVQPYLVFPDGRPTLAPRWTDPVGT